MPNESLRNVDVVKRCRVGTKVDLERFDPADTFGWDRQGAVGALIDEQANLIDLHMRLYAAEHNGLLVMLQATDAGGKGGTIRTVLAGLNPGGVDITQFGVPSAEELAHDYLWRVHAHVPRKGTLAVFDRSHYEDVLVVRVKGLVPDEVWKRRFGHIRDFERMLFDEGIHVVKIYLNVSKEEQRLRFQDRIDDPAERWKFRLGDLEDRKLWDDFRLAYRDAIGETSTDQAPWYIVPGDRKWVRNLVVAKILRHHLELIDPQYPPAEPGVEGLVVE